VGYNKDTEHTSSSREGMRQTVYVFLTPVGSSAAVTPASGVALTPSVQRELDKSLAALRQSKYDEARKHLAKAQKMAPSNPDILCLMGMVEYTAKDMPAARKQFELVLATYPTTQPAHARSNAAGSE
jgi:Flp pilus assembly protein TadD